MYSSADIDDTLVWRSLDCGAGGEDRNGYIVYTDGDAPHLNKVAVSPDRMKLVLMLYHFCCFTVIENGEEVNAIETNVGVWFSLKKEPSLCCVEVVVLVGSDANKLDKEATALTTNEKNEYKSFGSELDLM